MIFRPQFTEGEGLKEYPRPQFLRDSYIPLNGIWDYAITTSPQIPNKYDGKINVPYSPESPLSGAERGPSAREYLHYRTYFCIPQGFNRGKVIINFGACDQCCTVIINGKEVGGHEGGYLPFSFDITDCLASGEKRAVRNCFRRRRFAHIRQRQAKLQCGWHMVYGGKRHLAVGMAGKRA